MLTDVIESLRRDPEFSQRVTHWEVLPARPGKFADIPPGVDQRIRAALKYRGIDRIYSHQLATWNEVRAGKSVVLVSPTASGKTLAYNLPVLQTLLEDPDARALYLFPTKALSQDQQSELNEVVLGGDIPVKVFTYDGDTPGSIRISARDEGRIIITNPDMLHTGILPNHPKWIKALKRLRYVVIDEMHSYRGVFGSHMTSVIRRLKRIAEFYGARPVFICCSATIGNPHELAKKILEQDVTLVDDNGSPSGERHFVLYNPPLVDRVQGIRRSVVLESQRIATRLLKAGVKTIVFARSRVRTELIATYIRDSLKNFYTDNHGITVQSYRGGYLPNERRAIEKGLRDGSIQGVVSTNALELGIDIGGLDASILAGFPGTISSSWQQAGRAGRRNAVSLSILVASSSPTDQFVIQHPEYFFSRSPENGYIDPGNIFIQTDQLKCAVFELPFEQGEAFGEGTGDLLGYLSEQGVIRHAGSKWYWADRSYPAEGVSLRTSTPENVVIVDTTKGRDQVIGEMDMPSAKLLVFDHAIYIHLGDQFAVKQLDISNRRCFVEEADTDYWTDSIVKTDIKVLAEDEQRMAAGLRCVLGDILVRTQATKFKKLKFHTNENVGYGDIALPADEMHTRFVALLFDPSTGPGKIFGALSESEQGIVIQRLGVLLRTVAPVFLLCDPHDIGVAERVRDPHFDAPCLYIYDQYPGGIGLSEGFLGDLSRIARGAREVVDRCPCQSGCPSCIGAPDALVVPGAGPAAPAPGGAPAPDDISAAVAQASAVNAKQAVRAFLAAWTAALGE
ncbi:MAG: DEAD/DEAH box helicase [Spirochaetia bacterium]|jgi:DEAD/DEAH box helicase domain-containing protein